MARTQRELPKKLQYAILFLTPPGPVWVSIAPRLPLKRLLRILKQRGRIVLNQLYYRDDFDDLPHFTMPEDWLTKLATDGVIEIKHSSRRPLSQMSHPIARLAVDVSRKNGKSRGVVMHGLPPSKRKIECFGNHVRASDC
ncbi:hypothetical protein O181_082684 [Austropuccinia psidii MF-1]|uniref:Uncharacterized protein n=1 Tax=Austropuccinia psidii MF-1 TaxID=1389203 RepID=A0A9Q3FPR5_9BASI|nr:hypothetical protein [Austropuccinia psidii MF-1]